MQESVAISRGRTPRVLVVTPEITYLPDGMGNMANHLKAKAGGLADVSASLVAALFDLGVDVHVALPHYRRMFHVYVDAFISEELRVYKSKLPDQRVHLAEDRIFYYRDEVYSSGAENPRIALAFQREVINNILVRVRPDLIHCNDWMTGLVPAAARRMNIPCLFTVHNIHTCDMTLEGVEMSGIDAAEFWRHLYYRSVPGSYEETRARIPVDFLASGIFASHFVNTVSPSFLEEIAEGRHDFVPDAIRGEIANKNRADCAAGILNAPDPSYNPQTDRQIEVRYEAATHAPAKRENKRRLQKRLGLKVDPNAALFFWPSRLDPIQKGPQLLAHILYELASAYWRECLQIVFVANGAYQNVFRDIVRFHGLYDRVAVCDFDEALSRQAYAASDYLLMPSRFEPCGLPQMVGCIYGSLPVAHDTGGLRDTVSDLHADTSRGNGFVFKVYDPPGLHWAIDQAMSFHKLPESVRIREVARVMRESQATFNHSVTAQNYFGIYEKMLQRPLVNTF
jgi:starch synthase